MVGVPLSRNVGLTPILVAAMWLSRPPARASRKRRTAAAPSSLRQTQVNGRHAQHARPHLAAMLDHAGHCIRMAKETRGRFHIALGNELTDIGGGHHDPVHLDIVDAVVADAGLSHSSAIPAALPHPYNQSGCSGRK